MYNFLLIDNFDSFTYNLHHLLLKCGALKVDVIRNNEIDFDQILNYDALILSPGPGIPTEAGQMMQAISVASEKIPILGVCLGHQAIAEYFGGKLTNLENVYHGKQSSIHLKPDRIFKGLPERIKVGRYHSWAVDLNQSKDLVVIAEDEFNTIMAIKHLYLPIYGLQFHPESVLSEYSGEIITNWMQSIKLNQHN